MNRIRGLRANASRKSHAELNESTELDIGNPIELGTGYANLRQRLKYLNIMGGCCEHVLSKVQPGSISILHVMYSSRSESLKAVKKIIEGLKAKGYSFKTVSELLAARE